MYVVFIVVSTVNKVVAAFYGKILITDLTECPIVKVIVFPIPSRDVTNQTLPGWE